MLGWSVKRLAAAANLAPNTVLTFEAGRKVAAATEGAIHDALVAQGLSFSIHGNDVVVRLNAGHGRS